jgi:hypothetical protein
MSSKVVGSAREKRERRKQREENRGSGSGKEFVNPQMLGLAVNKDRSERVFRIVGRPYEERVDPSDAKFLYFSKFVKDDFSGYSNILWRTKDDEDGLPEIDTSFILYRLWKKATEYDWKEYTEEEKSQRQDDRNGEKIFKHAHTKTFQRITSNKANWDSYPKAVEIKKRVVMNVIDRQDNWCQENKHSKILFAKVDRYTPNGSTEEIERAHEYGVPNMFYDILWEEVVRHWGWDENGIPVDIVATATGKIPNAYKIYDAEDTKRIEDSSAKIASTKPLTQEEMSYELYDLDDIYKECSHYKLKENLIGLFKQCDADFGTNFTEELLELAKEEEKEYNESQKAKQSEEKKEEREDPQPAPQDKDEPEERPARESREEKSEQEEVDFEKVLSMLPNWDKLSELDKEDIKNGIEDIEGFVIRYKSDVKPVPCDDANCKFPESEIGTMLPSTVINCPVCGMKFETA